MDYKNNIFVLITGLHSGELINKNITYFRIDHHNDGNDFINIFFEDDKNKSIEVLFLLPKEQIQNQKFYEINGIITKDEFNTSLKGKKICICSSKANPNLSVCTVSNSSGNVNVDNCMLYTINQKDYSLYTLLKKVNNGTNVCEFSRVSKYDITSNSLIDPNRNEIQTLLKSFDSEISKNLEEENFFNLYNLRVSAFYTSLLMIEQDLQLQDNLLFYNSTGSGQDGCFTSLDDFFCYVGSIENKLKPGQVAILPIDLKTTIQSNYKKSFNLIPSDKNEIGHACIIICYKVGQKNIKRYCLDSSLAAYVFLFEPNNRIKKTVLKINLLDKQNFLKEKELCGIYSFQKGPFCRYYATFLNLEVCKEIKNNPEKTPIEVLNENLDLIILNGIKGVTNIIDKVKDHDPVIIDLPEGSKIQNDKYDKYDELILGNKRIAILKLDKEINSNCVKEKQFKCIIGQEVLKTIELNLRNFKTQGRQQEEIEKDLNQIFLGIINVISNSEINIKEKNRILNNFIESILLEEYGKSVFTDYFKNKKNDPSKNILKIRFLELIDSCDFSGKNPEMNEYSLIKSALKSTIKDEHCVILFDRPKDLNKFLYKPYYYTSGNPPQTKTVFILNDSDQSMKSQCVNLNDIRTMLNNKYKQPEIVDITKKSDSKQLFCF